MADPLAPFV